jgi:hypothetical protein
MICTDADKAVHEQRFAELIADRAELVALHARAIAQVSAAQTAYWIAANAGNEADAECFVDDDGVALTTAQLADLVKKFECREDLVCEAIAALDARIARYLADAA